MSSDPIASYRRFLSELVCNWLYTNFTSHSASKIFINS
nr:MAG TPA: hypothetical protein [Caudoviricetes sp.]